MTKIHLESCAKHNKKSWTRNETYIKELTPYFSGKDLGQITPLDIENYKKRAKGKG